MTEKKPDIIDIDVVDVDTSHLAPNRAGDLAQRILATGLAQAAAEHQNLEELRAAEEDRIRSLFPDTVRGKFEANLAIKQYFHDLFLPALYRAQQATILRVEQQNHFIHGLVMDIAQIEAENTKETHELELNRQLRLEQAKQALDKARLEASIQNLHDSQVLKVEAERAAIRIREAQAQGEIQANLERIRIEAEERAAQRRRDDAVVQQGLSLVRYLPEFRAQLELIQAEGTPEKAAKAMNLFMALATAAEDIQNASEEARPTVAREKLDISRQFALMSYEYDLRSLDKK